nr:putative uncharacterized protein ENSP00000383309 [Aegilops tauschii subsp. strangulata]
MLPRRTPPPSASACLLPHPRSSARLRPPLVARLHRCPPISSRIRAAPRASGLRPSAHLRRPLPSSVLLRAHRPPPGHPPPPAADHCPPLRVAGLRPPSAQLCAPSTSTLLRAAPAYTSSSSLFPTRAASLRCSPLPVAGLGAVRVGSV